MALLVLPVLAAVVWGVFVGPRAVRRLADPARLGVEVVLFAAGGTGLLVARHFWWAVGLVPLSATGVVHGRRGG